MRTGFETPSEAGYREPVFRYEAIDLREHYQYAAEAWLRRARTLEAMERALPPDREVDEPHRKYAKAVRGARAQAEQLSVHARRRAERLADGTYLLTEEHLRCVELDGPDALARVAQTFEEWQAAGEPARLEYW